MTDKDSNQLTPPADTPWQHETDSSGQRPSEQKEPSENEWRQLGRHFRLERLGNFIGCFILVLVLVAAIFYALNGQPLFPIEVRPSYTTPQQQILITQSAQFPKPAFVILGEYNGEFYTFNRGVEKVYAYNPTNSKEREVCRLADFDAFWWHSSGKVLVLSHARNTLGSIYVLDLTPAAPEPELITDRESAPRFPRNLSVEASLPVAWAAAGDAIAFVARDVQDNTESLFIFETTSKQLVYTPARSLERISSIMWVDGDKQLALVAISDGQESRYLVDRLGGGFTDWEIED